MIRDFKKGDVGHEVLFIQRIVGAKTTGVYDLQTCKCVSEWKKKMNISDISVAISQSTLQQMVNFAEPDELPLLFNDPRVEGNILSAKGFDTAALKDCMLTTGTSDIELAMLKAIIEVECGKDGFADDSRIKIQFEPYWFNHYENVRLKNGVEGQVAEYEAFFNAACIDPESAMLSTSFGMGQVCGFNHKRAGYSSAKEMVMDFTVSEYNQLKGMLNFIQSDPSLFKAAINRDYRGFAFEYNGPKYEKFNYHTRIETAYLKFKK